MGDNANVSPNLHIGVAGPSLYAQGATFNPVYVERCPPMWAVGDIDMMAISALETEAAIYFSLGSFFIGMAFNILLSASLSSSPLSDVGRFLVYGGAPFLGLMALIFGYLGWKATKRKASIWDRIKAETRTKQLPQV